MFDALSEKFDGIFKRMRGEAVISEQNVKDAVREVKMALLEADVNFQVVRDFVKRTQEKAMGEEVMRAVRPSQQFVKIVHDELRETMGGTATDFHLEVNRTNVILLLGLQGSGKTTFAGKLAQSMKKKHFDPLLVACDVYRPAAIHQLEVVGGQVGVPVYKREDSKDVAKIAREALHVAKTESHNLVIIDTAGRLHIDEVRMDELQNLRETVDPTYTFLVADAMTGQDAVNSAEAFKEQVGIDGVCLTKLDGDARGGAALSIRSVTGKPIVFVGVGEKLEDLEQFHPDRMASRILGMGDVLTLVEKAQEAMDEKEAERAMKMQKKLKRADINFQDFLDQMETVKKMGPLQSVMKMIPGLGNMTKDMDIDDRDIGKIRGIIHSMTPKEREMPEILTGTRRKRIAKGAGVTVPDVNDLIKQFEQTKKMMQQMMKAGGSMIPGMPGGGDGGAGKPGGGSNATTGFSKKKKKKKKKLKAKKKKR